MDRRSFTSWIPAVIKQQFIIAWCIRSTNKQHYTFSHCKCRVDRSTTFTTNVSCYLLNSGLNKIYQPAIIDAMQREKERASE